MGVDKARHDDLAAVILNLQFGFQFGAQLRRQLLIIASCHYLAVGDQQQTIFMPLMRICMMGRIGGEMKNASAVCLQCGLIDIAEADGCHETILE